MSKENYDLNSETVQLNPSPNKVSSASNSWNWEETDPDRSGSSGDLSKLFRNEPTKNPGVLGVNPPDPNATLMAREVIQNSWDAARELQRSREKQDRAAPSFELGFSYHNLKGQARTHIIERLDLESLASRASDEERHSLGLRMNDCLTKLSSSEILPVLMICEKGTTGMYGPWEGARSKMYLALVSLGYTAKEDDAGGSYGYGKAGLIRGSAIRCVVAYSCFRERDDDSATRRLLGMTYWGQHIHQGNDYTGFARFADDSSKPFTDEAADQIASELGIPLRDPDVPEDLGTTFLLIEPTVAPKDLLSAVERWWWPAINDEEFYVSVTLPNGKKEYPRPRINPQLQPFIRAHEIATSPQDNSPEEERKFSFNKISIGNESYESPGKLGLKADLQGWSFADEELSGAQDGDPTEHKSLVALMRSPNMVVEYYEAGQSPPYVRGAFVAGKSVDKDLRETEPKGHDAWRTTSDDGEIGAHSADVAKTILRRISDNVNRFRQSIKPPKPPPEDIRLSHFDSVIRRVMTGGNLGPNPPVGNTRPVSIRLNQELKSAGNDEVMLVGSARFSLSEHFKEDQAEVSVSIRYRYVEDDRLGSNCEINVEPESDFEPESDGDSKYKGTIVRDQNAVFEFETAPYPSTWTARLIVNADLVEHNVEVINE